MKFTDGRWLLRPGCIRRFSTVRLDAEGAGPGTLTSGPAVSRIRHRGVDRSRTTDDHFSKEDRAATETERDSGWTFKKWHRSS